MWNKQALLLSIFLMGSLVANPQGAETIAGKVNINAVDGKNLQVKASDRAVIHWKDFSISKGECTRFIQPSSQSTVLNRVTGLMPSQLNGLLQANGKVYLVNPNGVIIGKEGRIDTAGFLASTLDLLNSDFLKGEELLFKGDSKSGVINLGTIEAWDGDVLLLGHYISDEGSIRASKGIIGMGAGHSIIIKPHKAERLYILTEPQEEIEKDHIGIETSGTLQAIQAELKADGNAYAYAIKQKGHIEATATEERGGRIWLVAGNGQVTASGALTAQKNNGIGGDVYLLGDRVGLLEEGKIDVSGKNGGGTVLIGGDYQGKNPEIINSKLSLVEDKCYISADAKESGNGGRVILWSDGITGFYGDISARGGELQGDGGFVEVSGKGLPYLYKGNTDTRAPNGKTGTLLLDPTNITIQAAGDSNIIFNGGTFSANPPNAATATLSTGTLVGALNTSNVIVTTESAGPSVGTLTVTAPISWASNSSLTLLSNNVMTISDNITTTGSGSIILLAGSNMFFAAGAAQTIQTTSGDITLFSSAGNLDMSTLLTSNLTITSNSGTLSLATAAGDCRIDSAGLTKIQTLTGKLIFNIARDLNITPSAGGVEILPSTQTNTFSIGRDLDIEGGPNNNNFAQIGGIGGGTFGAMEFTVGRNVTLFGGDTGTNSFALIGHTRGPSPPASVNVSGDVIFHSIGGDLQLIATSVLGINGPNCFVQIGHINGSSAGNYQASGNIVINNVSGNVILQGGAAAGCTASIGHGNVFGAANGDQYSGNISIFNPGAGVQVLASNNADAYIGFFSDPTKTVTFSSGQVAVTSLGPITINAANGLNAAIGYYDLNATATVSIGQIHVEAGGDLTLNPGNLIANKGDAVIGTDASSGSVQSNIFISCRDLLLNGPTGSNTGRARITNQIIGTSAPFDVQINSRNAFVGNGNGVNGSTEIFSSRNLTMISDSNAQFSPTALVHNINGNLTVVVDNDFPSPPGIGPGQFIYQNGAVISSNGPVRIFTAMRPQNSIQGLLNGAVFVPGPLFVNSATEEWGVYFSPTFSGFPFTIFYKNELPASIQQNGLAISEFFKDIETYDDWIFAKKPFCEGYDELMYECQEYPASSLSSEEIICDEKRIMIQRKYRTYQTKFVKSF